MFIWFHCVEEKMMKMTEEEEEFVSLKTHTVISHLHQHISFTDSSKALQRHLNPQPAPGALFWI